MQAQDKISVPYANGILELAQERENLNEVHKDLMTLQVQRFPDQWARACSSSHRIEQCGF